MSKIDHSLFSAHEHALEEAFGLCPQCEGKLTLKHSPKGSFIGCASYPTCDYSKPLNETESTDLKVIDGSQCPKCGDLLSIKKGRYGLFIGCTNFPACDHIEPVKRHKDTGFTCPKCQTGNLIKRTNKFGKVFYACDNYPKCKYVLNSAPINGRCQACGWRVLVRKGGKADGPLVCPQKQCQHQQIE